MEPIPLDPLRLALAEACLEIRDFEERIRTVEKQLKLLAEQMPVVKQLLTIPGIGLVTATALIALDLVPIPGSSRVEWRHGRETGYPYLGRRAP